MKIAVISDIHGNMTALTTVLEDIKAQGCEKVFCLGDLAMAGPQPRAVIDFVRNEKDWTVIQGNTDQLICDFCPELFNAVMEKFPLMAKALADDVLVIEDDKKEYLKQLPAQAKLEIEGVKILLVHGSPRRNNEDISPNLPINIVEDMIKDTDADLILCGHTHVPAGYQTSSKQTVVNVGSIGRPMTEDLKSCYAIINIQNGGFSIEHRLLDYDRELAATIIRHRGFEDCDKLAEMLIKPSPRHQ